MMNLKKYKIADESLEDEDESNYSHKLETSHLKSKVMNETKEKENYSKLVSTNQTKKQNSQIPQTLLNQKEKNILFDESINSSQMNITNQLINKNMENVSQMDMTDLRDLRDLKEIPNNFENLEDKDAFHHPQLIDEDVENFKRRLDITLKNFRTDTMKEFMSIKRHLLVEQKNVIDSEKQKCDALLSSKVDQIEHLKENLARTKNALSKESEIKEKMAQALFKIKNTNYLNKLKTLAFTKSLKKYYIKKKKHQTVFNKIRENIFLKFKSKAFKGLKKNFKEMKIMKVISAKEKEFNEKLTEMSQYYGKEICDLRNKLAEANQTVEKYKESKNQIQENLKKALMRGVVAMNLEAMNVLDEDPKKMNFFDNINLGINSEGVVSNTGQVNNMQNMQKNNLTPMLGVNNNLTSNIIQKEERKVVVKDNNWVNAAAVPSKMKSNIISYNNEEFEEEEYAIPQTYINKQEPISDYYSELTKNLSNIRSEFDNIVKTTSNPYPGNINLDESDSSYMNDSSFVKSNIGMNVNVNVNPSSSNILNNILVMKNEKNEKSQIKDDNVFMYNHINSNSNNTGISSISNLNAVNSTGVTSVRKNNTSILTNNMVNTSTMNNSIKKNSGMVIKENLDKGKKITSVSGLATGTMKKNSMK